MYCFLSSSQVPVSVLHAERLRRVPGPPDAVSGAASVPGWSSSPGPESGTKSSEWLGLLGPADDGQHDPEEEAVVVGCAEFVHVVGDFLARGGEEEARCVEAVESEAGGELGL